MYNHDPHSNISLHLLKLAHQPPNHACTATCTLSLPCTVFVNKALHTAPLLHPPQDSCLQFNRFLVIFFRSPFDVETKSDASPVTIADKQAETAMRELITKVGAQAGPGARGAGYSIPTWQHTIGTW